MRSGSGRRRGDGRSNGFRRADQVAALLSAAGKIDADAREGDTRRRRPLLATLTLAGLRISEALDLRWRDVNLEARRLRVATAKTDAGVREVDLTPRCKNCSPITGAAARTRNREIWSFRPARASGTTPQRP
jgi:integrase